MIAFIEIQQFPPRASTEVTVVRKNVLFNRQNVQWNQTVWWAAVHRNRLKQHLCILRRRISVAFSFLTTDCHYIQVKNQTKKKKKHTHTHHTQHFIHMAVLSPKILNQMFFFSKGFRWTWLLLCLSCTECCPFYHWYINSCSYVILLC